MHVGADKAQQNQNKAAASEPSQRSSGAARFEFVDNRAEAVQLRKLKEIADNSRQAVWQLPSNKKGPSPFQLAGDPEGMLPQHPSRSEGGAYPAKYTFHHIVPENKLEDAWNEIAKAEENPLKDPEDSEKMLPGFQATLTKGFSTFFDSAVHNLRMELTNEFKDYEKLLKGGQVPGDDALRKIVVSLCDPEDKDIITGKDAAIAVLADNPGNSDVLKVNNFFNKWTKAVDVTEESAKDVSTAPAENTVLKHMIMWIPGNIHRGPTDRISPGGIGFDENIDDGGSEFEGSAKHLVPTPHWKALNALRDTVEKVTKAVSTENMKHLSEALVALSAFGLTDYDPHRWEKCTGLREGKWEIVPRE